MNKSMLSKEFIMKNIASVLSGLIVAFMLLPMISSEVNVEVMGQSGGTQSSSLNGFNVLTNGGLSGILLIAVPAVLLIINYVEQLKKYKKYIYLIAPILGLVTLIFLVPGQVTSSTASADAASVEVKINFLIGFWLMILGYLGLMAYGVIEFFNINLRNGIPQISGMPIVNIPKPDISKFTSAIGNIQQEGKPTIRKQTIQSTDEILETIQKLHNMKESGIITEEEFSDKKKALLELMEF